MNVKPLAVGALAAALLTTGALLGIGSATAATVAPRTTVMLAGDSITQGRDGDYTWRYRFAAEVRRQGATNVDLVGPKTAPASFGSKYPHYLATGWDTDHDATSRTTLATELGYIENQVATYKPDVLISYLGTNDFLKVPHAHPGLSAAALMPYYERQVATTLEDQKTYLDKVRTASPTTDIVLGELVSTRIPRAIRDEYNAELGKRATDGRWFALGSKLEVTQLAGSLWSSPAYLYDGVHPTPTGEAYLAQQFATALDQVDPSILPGPIQIYRGFIAWNPPLTTKVHVARGRITLDWSFASAYNSATGMRVRFATVRTGKVMTIPFRTSKTWTSRILQPGRYRIRLQARRVTMDSTWGQTYVITVPRPRS